TAVASCRIERARTFSGTSQPPLELRVEAPAEGRVAGGSAPLAVSRTDEVVPGDRGFGRSEPRAEARVERRGVRDLLERADVTGHEIELDVTPEIERAARAPLVIGIVAEGGGAAEIGVAGLHEQELALEQSARAQPPPRHHAPVRPRFDAVKRSAETVREFR